MTEQAQHAPGPWTAGAHFAERCGGRTYIPILRPGNDPVPIAVVHRDVDGYGRDVGEANARLIAAAPVMADALAKLSNEVIGSLPLMEALCRREFGNSNYNILMQRAEEARAIVRAALSSGECGP